MKKGRRKRKGNRHRTPASSSLFRPGRSAGSKRRRGITRTLPAPRRSRSMRVRPLQAAAAITAEDSSRNRPASKAVRIKELLSRKAVLISAGKTASRGRRKARTRKARRAMTVTIDLIAATVRTATSKGDVRKAATTRARVKVTRVKVTRVKVTSRTAITAITARSRSRNRPACRLKIMQEAPPIGGASCMI